MPKLSAVVNVLMIPKEMNVDIADHLQHYEFQCRCTFDDCTYTLISQDLISAWNALRKSHGKPLLINSGYRCQRHNSNPIIKGVNHSRHKSGHAIDIYTGGFDDAQTIDFIDRAELHFDYVKVYTKFIHCHTEPDTAKRIFVGHFDEQVSS